MAQYSTAFGIDSHARTTTICAIIKETGEIKTRTFPRNDYGEMAEWMTSFPGPHYAVYESGCTGFYPCRILRSLGINIDVIAVSKLAKSPDDTLKKNDKNDAIRLAKAILAYDVTPIYVPDKECEGLRDLSRALEDLRGRTMSAKQQLTAFLLRHGLVWSERTKTGKLKKYWSKDHRMWLDRITFEDLSTQIAFETYLDEVRECMHRYDILLKQVHKQAQNPRFKPVIDAIRAIKGCGFIVALAIASEIDDFSRFKNARSVSAYFGLVPKENSSGEKRARNGGLTRSGNALVRKLLIEGSWAYARATNAEKIFEKDMQVSESIRRHAKAGSLRLKNRREAFARSGLHPCKANSATASELVRWVWVLGKMAQDEQLSLQAAV